jgi:hypothetical protein
VEPRIGSIGVPGLFSGQVFVLHGKADGTQHDGALVGEELILPIEVAARDYIRRLDLGDVVSRLSITALRVLDSLKKIGVSPALLFPGAVSVRL